MQMVGDDQQSSFFVRHPLAIGIIVSFIFLGIAGYSILSIKSTSQGSGVGMMHREQEKQKPPTQAAILQSLNAPSMPAPGEVLPESSQLLKTISAPPAKTSPAKPDKATQAIIDSLSTPK